MEPPQERALLGDLPPPPFRGSAFLKRPGPRLVARGGVIHARFDVLDHLVAAACAEARCGLRFPQSSTLDVLPLPPFADQPTPRLPRERVVLPGSEGELERTRPSVVGPHDNLAVEHDGDGHYVDTSGVDKEKQAWR